MALDDVARDRHAEAKPAIVAAPLDVRLAETLEHVGEEFAADPDATVLHDELRETVVAPQRHVHDAILG